MDAIGELVVGTLDFVYAPSADVAADVRWLGAVLDATVVFAIESEGTRVAMLRMGSGAPPLLVADHLHDQRPIFLYRVEDIEAASMRMAAHGLTDGLRVELPPGPGLVFDAPGGLRLGIYQPSRLAVVESWAGTRDF
jgi:hypothetical protein